jgi:hypothetical protein
MRHDVVIKNSSRTKHRDSRAAVNRRCLLVSTQGRFSLTHEIASWSISNPWFRYRPGSNFVGARGATCAAGPQSDRLFGARHIAGDCSFQRTPKGEPATYHAMAGVKENRTTFHPANHTLTLIRRISLRHRPASPSQINADRLTYPAIHARKNVRQSALVLWMVQVVET